MSRNKYIFDIAELSDDDIKYITNRMQKEVPEELHKIKKKFDYLFPKKKGGDFLDRRRNIERNS